MDNNQSLSEELEYTKQRLNSYKLCVKSLLFEKYLAHEKIKKRDKILSFVIYFNTCYAHFRDFDYINNCTNSEKAYWDRFIKIIKNKESNFDYEKEEDWNHLRELESNDPNSLHPKCKWLREVVNKFVLEESQSINN